MNWRRFIDGAQSCKSGLSSLGIDIPPWFLGPQLSYPTLVAEDDSA
jgi:hypothetical protein